MGTTTLDARVTVGDAAEQGDGFFARAWKRFLAAQEVRASRIVSRQLSGLSQRQLHDLGFEESQIAKIRAVVDEVAPYWI